MHRCFVEPVNWAEDVVVLPRDESHHLLHVLRAAKGDSVNLFDGTGNEAEARIASVKDQNATLEIVRTSKASRQHIMFTLIQSLPKSRKMDLIVEKATELGISEISPVITERTVTRLNPRRCAAHSERWLRLARSASKQCGTPWIPKINPVMTYPEALNMCSHFDALLVGTLEPGTISLTEAIHTLKQQSPRKIAFLIGPEGDLTANEVDAARCAGGIAVSFGTLVLRVETAALYAMSILSYEFTGGNFLKSPQ